MNFLLFGGQPDSGKTSTVTRLTNLLLSAPFSFVVVDGTFPPTRGTDFLILLQRTFDGQHQYIIVNSPSDDAPAINNLRDFIVKHSDKNIDIVVSSHSLTSRHFQFFVKNIPIKEQADKV